MWKLDHKESWAPKNWCFWTVLLEKTLESPLDCKEIQPLNLKRNHWKDWCWSWNCSTLATWCAELTYWKRPWFWKGLKAGGEGDDRGWDGLMASLTWCTWVWINSRDGEGQGTLACCSPAAAARSLQSCPTLCDPIDSSPPGSPVPGILQERTLEWVAISFSNAWKWKVKVKSLSCVQLLATPWPAAYQAPPSMGFARQEYWVGCIAFSGAAVHGVKKSHTCQSDWTELNWMVTTDLTWLFTLKLNEIQNVISSTEKICVYPCP